VVSRLSAVRRATRRSRQARCAAAVVSPTIASVARPSRSMSSGLNAGVGERSSMSPEIEPPNRERYSRTPAIGVGVGHAERPHQRPAQSEPIAHHRVHLVHAGHAALDQGDGLADERHLQAVEQEARDVAPQLDRHLPSSAQHLDRPRACRLARVLAAQHLDRGDHVRRVDRMGDDAAMSAGEVARDRGHVERGGARRENRIGGRCRVERGEDRALGVQRLGAVLLDPHHAVHHVGDRRAQLHLGARSSVARTLIGVPRERGLHRLLRRIPQPYWVTGAREDPHPAPTDHATRDDRDRRLQRRFARHSHRRPSAS
jgi:hypothetical protein